MITAERIRARRKYLGLSQIDLEELTGISQSQISRYEKGENEPTSYALSLLAKVLGTTSDWLIGLTDDYNIPIDGKEGFNDEERNLVEIYRSKSRESQEKIIEMAKII